MLSNERIEELKKDLIEYKYEIQRMLLENKSLKDINKWSYEQRESGRNVPYLQISDTENGQITTLWANAISRQKDLKEFFDIKPEGSAMSKFSFFVTKDGVTFKEKLGKGKDNYKLLN